MELTWGKEKSGKFFLKHRVELITMCLGILIFILEYGVKVIDPTNTAWLSLGGDSQQHYLGWCFFRRSKWYFPFGMMEGVVAPELTSIVYVDGLPIMALPFKLLSPILPDTFQYFGLWGVLSAGLIGLFSGKILKLYMDSTWIICLSSLFFILTPVFYRRMFAHTALASIWILLWAIYLLCKKSCQHHIRSGGGYNWAVLSMVCASVHIYYIPLCGICLLGWMLIDIFDTKSLKNSVVAFASYCGAGLFVLFCLGAFGASGAVLSSNTLLGKYSANLNSFINPLGGWSRVINDLPVYDSGQYEGFAYLGLGMLLLLGFAVGVRVLSICRKKVCIHKNRAIPWAVVIAISTLVALGPTASIGNRVVYQIELPEFIKRIWGMFYACGRFIWIPMFCAMIFACCTYRYIKHKKCYMLVLCICIAAQLFDFSTKYANIHGCYTADRVWTNVTADAITEVVGERMQDYRHIVLVSRELFYSDKTLMDFARVALSEDMTMNFFLVSRRPREEAFAYTMSNIMTDLSDETIYIFAAEDAENNFLESLYQYPIGEEYIIGVTEQLP